MGVDFRGSCGLDNLGSARGVGRGFLYLEPVVGFVVDLESHRDHLRRFGRRINPSVHLGVKLHMRHEDPNRRFTVGLGYSGLDCLARGVSWPEFGFAILLAQFTGGHFCFIVVDGEGVSCSLRGLLM